MDTRFNDVVKAALAVAIRAADRQPVTNKVMVPWTMVNTLREELEKAGIPYRELRKKAYAKKKKETA